jgi:antitoxin component YwqK of YwqJK toxin-antitoxin module
MSTQKYTMNHFRFSRYQIGYFNQVNQKDSLWLMYNNTGKLIGSANYKNGVKEGLWEIYNDYGIKKIELLYVNNVKISVKEWDDNGLLINNKDY